MADVLIISPDRMSLSNLRTMCVLLGNATLPYIDARSPVDHSKALLTVLEVRGSVAHVKVPFARLRG